MIQNRSERTRKYVINKQPKAANFIQTIKLLIMIDKLLICKSYAY